MNHTELSNWRKRHTSIQTPSDIQWKELQPQVQAARKFHVGKGSSHSATDSPFLEEMPTWGTSSPTGDSVEVVHDQGLALYLTSGNHPFCSLKSQSDHLRTVPNTVSSSLSYCPYLNCPYNHLPPKIFSQSDRTQNSCLLKTFTLLAFDAITA